MNNISPFDDPLLPASSSAKIPLAKRAGGAIATIIREAWSPTPPLPPRVHPHLPYMSAVERSAEVLRWGVLKLERKLSPNGTLRAWINLNLVFALFLAVPVFVFLPVVNQLFGELRVISTNFAESVLMLIKGFAALTAGLLLLRVMVGGWWRF